MVAVDRCSGPQALVQLVLTDAADQREHLPVGGALERRLGSNPQKRGLVTNNNIGHTIGVRARRSVFSRPMLLVRIMFTDIDMPGPDSLRLAAAVRDRWPPIKILVTSEHRLADDAEMPIGAVFLSKPYDYALQCGHASSPRRYPFDGLARHLILAT